jgi:hypothetical protein
VECETWDAAAVCRHGVCLRGCQPGVQRHSISKCLGRQDLACDSEVARAALSAPLGADLQAVGSSGHCAPRCRHDADCPARSCDLNSGLCTDTVSGGAPVGAFCSTDAECSGGVCLDREGRRACTALCHFGATGCGALPGAEQDFTCRGRLASDQAEGDLGYCEELCDDAADCAQPGSGCEPLPRPIGDRAGVCRALLRAPLGGGCGSDDECSPPLGCARSDASARLPGPAHGYCTQPCTSSPQCEALEPGAVCGPQAFCLKGCTIGSSAPAATKCLGRTDVACTPVADGIVLDLGEVLDPRRQIPSIGDSAMTLAGDPGACHPQCGSDSDCAPLSCALRTGLCSPEVRPGKGIGEPCATDDECAGSCEIWSPTAGFCSGYCRVGSAGCGHAAADPLRHSRCMQPNTALSTGDRALCQQACNQRAECAFPRAVCLRDPSTSEAGYFGYCAP